MKRILLNVMLVFVLGTGLVISQPSFPTNPNQAPIDGGLGLLAAAGGTYAYKKLKEKRNQEDTSD